MDRFVSQLLLEKTDANIIFAGPAVQPQQMIDDLQKMGARLTIEIR